MFGSLSASDFLFLPSFRKTSGIDIYLPTYQLSTFLRQASLCLLPKQAPSPTLPARPQAFAQRNIGGGRLLMCGMGILRIFALLGGVYSGFCPFSLKTAPRAFITVGTFTRLARHYGVYIYQYSSVFTTHELSPSLIPSCLSPHGVGLLLFSLCSIQLTATVPDTY